MSFLCKRSVCAPEPADLIYDAEIKLQVDLIWFVNVVTYGIETWVDGLSSWTDYTIQ